jgi:hypothetical protein
MGSDTMIPGHVHDKPIMFWFPDTNEWKKGVQPDRKEGIIWYTDGSKPKKKKKH